MWVMQGYLSSVMISQACVTAIILRIGVMRKSKRLSNHCRASVLMMISFSQRWSEHISQACCKLLCLHRSVFLNCLIIKITFSPFFSHKVGTISRRGNKICMWYGTMSTDYTVSIIKWELFYLNFRLEQNHNNGIFSSLTHII